MIYDLFIVPCVSPTIYKTPDTSVEDLCNNPNNDFNLIF